MSTPDVSVIMPTYNHAPFVEEAMRSVLAQEGVSFEFLIADDGSKDGTADAVRRISDRRIQFTAHPINRGACVTTNELISKAQGKYVALINSDDRWVGTDKLLKQVRLLESHPNIGASFGRARYIDQAGKPLAKRDLQTGSVFDKDNRSRGAWLRHFFDHGNCLLHPSVLIRRSCYEELGAYDNRYRQLPDFDMWIRVIKRYDIHVAPEDYVEFRILPGENASSQTMANGIRTINEHYLIARQFFDGIRPEELQQGFADQCAGHFDSADCVRIEGALLLMGLKGSYSPDLDNPYKVAALEKFFDLLGNEHTRALLKERFDIDDLWFQKRMSEVAVLRFRVDPNLIAGTPPKPERKRRKVKRLIKQLFQRS